MSETAVQALKEAVTAKTVAGNRQEFRKLHQIFRKHFPLVFGKCETIDVPGTDALLLRLKGRSAEKPSMFTGHMDVVPADESEWSVGPFAGHSDETWIWGRGSFDDKVSVVCILAGLESLLKEGFVPANDLYFGFGDDEEIMGRGASEICKVLESRGVKLEMLLDEGGAVVEDFLPLMENPVGAVGVAEKGSLVLKMSISGKGGHSSSPVNPGALARLGKAVWNAEQTEFPVRWLPCVEEMMRLVSGFMKGSRAFAAKHNEAMRPIVSRVMTKDTAMAPFIRSTCVATMFRGSDAFNIIPENPCAVLNIRYLPGEKSSDIVELIRKNVNDSDIKFEILNDRAPSSLLTDSSGESFAKLKETLKEVYPDVCVIPYLLVGASDAYRYEGICRNVLRLSPVRLPKGELDRMHGIDERISVANVENAENFYTRLIKKL